MTRQRAVGSNPTLSARFLQNIVFLIRSDTQEAEGAPLLRESACKKRARVQISLTPPKSSEKLEKRKALQTVRLQGFFLYLQGFAWISGVQKERRKVQRKIR